MHVEDVPYFRSSSHFALDIPPRNDLILAVPCVLYAYESGGDCDPRSYINRTLAHLPESKHIFSKIYATASAGIMNLSNPVSWSLENGVVKVHIDFESTNSTMSSLRNYIEIWSSMMNIWINLKFYSGVQLFPISHFKNASGQFSDVVFAFNFVITENFATTGTLFFLGGTNYSTSARIRTENSKIFLTFQSGETIAQFSNSSIVAELELSTNPANYHVLIEIRLSVCAMSIWLNDRLEKVGKCQSAAGLEKWADESGFGFFGKPPTNFPVDISLDGSSTESILKPFLRIYEADYQAIRNSPLVHVSCKLCLDSDLKYFADKLVSYNDGNYLSDLSNVWWKLGTISVPNVPGALIQFSECKHSCFVGENSFDFPHNLVNYLLHGSEIQSKCDFNFLLSSNASLEQNTSFSVNSSSCQISSYFRCIDGNLRSPDQCVSGVPCGCGSSPCRISYIASSHGTATFFPLPIPAYGVDGFWSTTALLDNQTLQHRSRLAVECKNGHRKGIRGSKFSQCNSTKNFSLTCNDCSFEPLECLPVQCGVFIPLNNASVRSSGKLLFGETVIVECPVGTRAMPNRETHSAPIRDACSYNRTYQAVCNDSCGYDFNETCIPIFCPALLETVTTDAHISEFSTTINASQAFGGVVQVHCLTGYRVGSNQSSAPKSFFATCEDDCSYSNVLECNLVSCGKLDLTPSNARVKDSVDRSEIELLHGQSTIIACIYGFYVGSNGSTYQNSSKEYNLNCFDGEYSAVQACVPHVCSEYNSLQPLDDPYAEYWTSGNNEIFSTINVTCKEGYRASTGVGIVDCDFPRSYNATCSLNGWESIYKCKPISCTSYDMRLGMQGSNSETIILFNRTLTVTCATGYIPWRTDGSNQSNTNIFPEPQYDAITNSWRQTSCSGMTFQERCQSDCTFTKSWSCESATCPPYSSLNLNSFTVGEPQSSTNAANTLEIGCPHGFRFDDPYQGSTTTTIGCDDDCIYRRRDVVNGSLSCLVISCGELQIPPNALIAWQSGDSTRPTAIWNDTFILACSAGFRITNSVPPNCNYHFKITCSSDGTFRLVDMQSEALQKDFSVAATGEKLVLSRTEIQEFFSSNPVGGPESTCSNLACGCGQCLQKLDFLRPLNYSEIVDLGTEQELPGYVSPHYITRNTAVEFICKPGYSIQNGTMPERLSWKTTCAAPNDDGVDGEAASVVKFWNCGFLEPPPCEPLHCPTFDPPANSQVVTSTWSTDRKYGYGDSSEIEIVCETGYFRSDSNEHQCLQSWKIKCGVKGKWVLSENTSKLADVYCRPVWCPLSFMVFANYSNTTVPNANTRVMLPNGQFLLANQLSGVVQYSESVTISCVESYAFSKEGSRNLICQQNCQFDSVATTCVLFQGKCPAIDFFEVGSSVEPNNYFSGLQPLNAFQKVEIKCKIGYVLDNSTGPVVVAGLESLGPVKVLDNKLFPPPTDGGTLGLASSGVQISMPKDVWPTDAGALSITVIDLNAIFSLRRKLLADDGGKLLSMGYNFGPDGVQFKSAVTITIPFNKDEALPYLNQNFELAVWKLNTSTFTWERKPYPEGMNRDTAVKTTDGVVLGSTTSFSTYAVRVTPNGIAQAPAMSPESSNSETTPSTTEKLNVQVMTTPVTVAAPPSIAVTPKGFSCGNNAYCIGGISGGGAACALLCIAIAYRRRKSRFSVEGAKGQEDHAEKDELDSGIEELRSKIEADDGEDVLLSLEEAKQQLKSMKGIKPKPGSIESLTIDWLKATVSWRLSELELVQDQKKERLAKTAIERNLLDEIRNPYFYVLYLNVDKEDLEQESNLNILKSAITSSANPPPGQAQIDSIVQEAHNKVGKGSKITFYFQNQNLEPFQLSADKLYENLKNSGIGGKKTNEIKKFIIGRYDEGTLKASNVGQLKGMMRDNFGDRTFKEPFLGKQSFYSRVLQAVPQRNSMQDFVDKKLAKTGVQSKEVFLLKERVKFWRRKINAFQLQKEIEQLQEVKQNRDTESAVTKILEKKQKRLEEQETRMREKADQERLLQESANQANSVERSQSKFRKFFPSFTKESIPVAEGKIEREEVSNVENIEEETQSKASMEVPTNPRQEELIQMLDMLERLKQQLCEAGFNVDTVDELIKRIRDLLASGREISEVELENLKIRIRPDQERLLDYTNWTKNFSRLKDFKNRTGHAAVPMNSKWFDGELGPWVQEQRELYRADRLENFKIHALEDLEFCWDEETAQSAISRAAGTVHRKIEIGDSLSAVAELGFPSGMRHHNPRIPFWNTFVSAVSAVLPPQNVEGHLGFVQDRDQQLLLSDEAGTEENDTIFQRGHIPT
uniref:Helicase-associated domain-containing protein n=1 Tax=Hanusia phi TaxID=3032 RepID=A0A7S0I4A7_9CRYP